ncbi:MAG: MogA/MoaB family molybdenum cofactor biosynthesis protein [Candidatus Eisenbacteria bacterium]|uniref:MogA/MoaB family molybdenum cofactor biosynthesis protein n=1 Tax=Eiseniibacteriota bacterium TaxID=2212470 RepID=A0A948W5Y0_UNCEI|nr:MogA/MoaB family molybdenum cofactor biosynthesis protein [Candidatus Eisenbacteria bacterium]MBU1951012.1 MogA/MoaB family molybdenum cofactor biosynthesis protein [Candidatus Eisenbacteria bacterium]MBU2690041.1 MogA/MoaB family molybdenum cofactor biosynthesis protein [Candidatus Eisenbacteria bacterium]
MMRVAVLTVSDRSARGERKDRSGPHIQEIVKEMGWDVILTSIVPDEREMIKDTLRQWCDRGQVDLILTTGGTGFHPRDVTPEATREVLERPSPGIDELMRRAGLEATPKAALSRGISGIRGKTLIINLPGRPRAIRENLDPVLGILMHAVQVCRGDISA